MKSVQLIVTLLILCLSGVNDAWAHGRVRHSVVIGHHWGPGWSVGHHWGPGWGMGHHWGPGWGYRAPFYPVYAQPVVIDRSPPPVYIERPVPQPAASNAQTGAHMWYYCEAQQGYYPYIQQCPGGWMLVHPVPVR